MKTTVVNLREAKKPFVYIGRAGHGEDGYFGNPFDVRVYGRAALSKFREYFAGRLNTDPEFRRRVLTLRGKVLGCFCKPKACHGDVIAEWIDAQPPICDTCGDSHVMVLHQYGDERQVPCTYCPTPCEDCRSRGPQGGGGAYCAETPCACRCHESKRGYRPKVTPSVALAAKCGGKTCVVERDGSETHQPTDPSCAVVADLRRKLADGDLQPHPHFEVIDEAAPIDREALERALLGSDPWFMDAVQGTPYRSFQWCACGHRRHDGPCTAVTDLCTCTAFMPMIATATSNVPEVFYGSSPRCRLDNCGGVTLPNGWTLHSKQCRTLSCEACGAQGAKVHAFCGACGARQPPRRAA